MLGPPSGGMASLPLRGRRCASLGSRCRQDGCPHGGAALKRWRYVGVYTPELLLCVGKARIGPLPHQWWAVADPEGALYKASSIRRGGVTMDGPSERVAAPGTRIELTLEDSAGVETASLVGERGNYAWTSKRAGVWVRGSVAADGREHRIEGPHGFVDDSAGYHARHTEWRWSAGLGRTGDGRRVGWNWSRESTMLRGPASARCGWTAGRGSWARWRWPPIPPGCRSPKEGRSASPSGRPARSRETSCSCARPIASLSGPSPGAAGRPATQRGVRRHGAPRRVVVSARLAEWVCPPSPDG